MRNILSNRIIILVLPTIFVLLTASCNKTDKTAEIDAPVFNQKYFKDLSNHRIDLNTYFFSANTPLSDSLKKVFDGLQFYPIDTNYVVEAIFEETTNGEIFQFPATGSSADDYKAVGQLKFKIKGKDLKLDIYENQNERSKEADVYFVPFFDLTNGKETYAGGRYLDIPKIRSKKIFLDFNKTYQPYCVYNSEYSCPIPPMANFLQVEVRAGEKL